MDSLNDISVNQEQAILGYSLLKDPCSDRAVKYLPLPPNNPLDDDLLFDPKNKGLPNWKVVQ